jgi:hypothetical protein
MKVDDIQIVEGCIKNLAREYQYKKIRRCIILILSFYKNYVLNVKIL